MATAWISAARATRTHHPCAIDSAAIEAMLKRSRRWRLSAELLSTPTVQPPEITPKVIVPNWASQVRRGKRCAGGFFASLAVHVVVFIAAAWTAVAPTPTQFSSWLVAEGSPLDDVSPQEIVVQAPLADMTDNARADHESFVATFASIELDPGVMHGGGREIELVGPSEQLAAALAPAPGLSDRPGKGRSTDGTGQGGSGGKPEGDQGAEFFGVKAAGNSFVFVCDCSRSMSGEKWFELHRELARSIEQLGPGKSFYIVFFDGAMHPMYEPDFVERSLVPATSENLDKTRQWLSIVPLGANTSPFESMKFAVSLEPDAVFLLTDGEFSDYTAPYLREFNRKRRSQQQRPVVVHTIGFFARKHQMVLERIARDSGGTYKFVEPRHIAARKGSPVSASTRTP